MSAHARAASRTRRNCYDKIDAEPPEELRPFAMQEVIAEKERELAQLHGFTAVDQLLKERDTQLAEQQDKFERLSEDFRHNLKLLDGRDSFIAKLQDKLKRAQSESKEYYEELAVVKKQLQQSSQHGNENRERWETTQMELEGVKVASSETIAKLRADVLRLETKYEKLLRGARAEAAEAASELNKLQEATEGDARQISDLEEKLLDAESRLGDSESQVKVMASTLKEADLRIQQLEHELERQRLEYREGAEKQLKRDVFAVKKYYEEKMEKLRNELAEDYEAKYAKVVESVKGMESVFDKHKQQQGCRLQKAVDEAERWKDEAEELRNQMRQVQRRVQVLQDDYSRMVAESTANAELLEVRRRETLDSKTADHLAQASDGLHSELKTKLAQALSEREASDARVRELQSELDRQRLAVEKLEVQLREGNDAVVDARSRREQAEAMLRRSEDVGCEMAKQVVWGAIMAQLADAYVDVAIAAQQAEGVSFVDGSGADADAIVEAQMALRAVKEAVRRGRHSLKHASRAQQLRLSEPEAKRLAEDTAAIEAEIRRCKARSAQSGMLGGDMRGKYKALKKKLAQQKSEVARLTKLLDVHEISIDIPSQSRQRGIPVAGTRGRCMPARSLSPRSGGAAGSPRRGRSVAFPTESVAVAGSRWDAGAAEPFHHPERRTSADVRSSISAVIAAAQTAISHREAAEAEARQAGIEVGSSREGVAPRRLGSMRRSFSPLRSAEEADAPQLASPELWPPAAFSSPPRSGSKSASKRRPVSRNKKKRVGGVGTGGVGLEEPRRWSEAELGLWGDRSPGRGAGGRRASLSPTSPTRGATSARRSARSPATLRYPSPQR